MNKKKFFACLIAITMLVICIVGTIDASANSNPKGKCTSSNSTNNFQEAKTKSGIKNPRQEKTIVMSLMLHLMKSQKNGKILVRMKKR